MQVSDIIESVDILEYVQQYCDLQLQNGEYWGLSPFKEEKTPSFSVNVEKQVYKDFSSGKGGNIISFIKDLTGCSTQEAVIKLKQYAGIKDDDAAYRALPAMVKIARKYKLPKKKVIEKSTAEILPDTYMEIYENDKEKIAEWTKEGMSYEVLDKFSVRYDPYSNRLVYPIRNYEGSIVNVCGRTLDKDFKGKGLRKYTYFMKWGGQMNVIFGFSDHISEIQKAGCIILFEGAKSVFLAETWGYKNTGALLTSHLSDGQFEFLMQLGLPVVFALDEEIDPAQDKNIQRLKRYCKVYQVRNRDKLLAHQMSPVDAGKEVWEQLLRKADRII